MIQNLWIGVNWRETGKEVFLTINKEGNPLLLIMKFFCVCFWAEKNKTSFLQSFEWDGFLGSYVRVQGPSRDNGCSKCLKYLRPLISLSLICMPHDVLLRNKFSSRLCKLQSTLHIGARRAFPLISLFNEMSRNFGGLRMGSRVINHVLS